MRTNTSPLTWLIILALAVAVAPARAVWEPRRLGDDERRVELAQVETRPFPAELLASLQGWTGDPLTPESLEGQVMVLLAWDSEEARAVRLLPTLARLERTRRGSITVLAVHSAEHWGSAREMIDAGRIRCLAAHDADGALFEALKADGHPNLYLVDRAGNTRVADLDPRDVQRAVGALVRETPEEARADLPRRIELLAELRERSKPEASPTGYPGPRTERPERPEGDGEPRPVIPATAYANAAWPQRNIHTVNANDLQGQRLRAPAGTETWITQKPERPVGEHVVVLDFWATWCGPCIAASPKLDAIQRAHQGEVLVLAMSGQAAGSKWPEDEPAIRRYVEGRPVAYSHLHDAGQTLYKRVGPRGIPHAVVISTDGVVRWQGNPHDPNFSRTVKAVVEADPLLAARRASGGG